VAKEKEAAEQAASAEDSQAEDSVPEDSVPEDSKRQDEDVTPAASAAAEPTKQQAQQGDESPAPPPASFEVLVTMLFTQSMALLGQMPDPASGETTVNKPFAKHYIDTLDMLSEKTSGNLSENETKMLGEALHALRMMYVNVKG
jgi:hypothetical protein